MDHTDKEISYHIQQILNLIGENTEREGLKDTPNRVARMFKEVFTGYNTPVPTLKTFSSENNAMIIKTGITVFSHCEHHMVPMKLNVSFAYIPNGQVVGISKIIRLIKWCAARLTLQEELTENITREFEKQVNCRGCMCIIKGHHFCEEMRGVKTENQTTTSSITGVFINLRTREEALSLMKNYDN